MTRYITSLFLLFFFALSSVAASAPDSVMTDKAKADKAYAAEQYEQAAHIYQQLAQRGESLEVYYNLGNCYYRLDDIAHAILWYERALLLSPGDSDVRFNLRLARTKTVDKILPEEELFFVRWYHTLLNVTSASGWARTGIVFFVLTLLAFAAYFLASSLRFRKMGFYGGVVLLLVVLASNLMAWHQNVRQQHRDRAILVYQSAAVKSTPSENGTDILLLHSGTSMQIIDASMDGWRQIRLSDGKEGWIPESAIEVI